MSDDTVKPKRILVVEDEADLRVYISRVFEEGGFRTACAEDGDEALRAVEKERPDLITLDLSLPGTSGVRAYRTLKSRPETAGIPVIFITGVTGPGGSRDTERFYFNRRQMPPPEGFLAKPVDPQQVLALATKLLSLTSTRNQPEQEPTTKEEGLAAP